MSEWKTSLRFGWLMMMFVVVEYEPRHDQISPPLTLSLPDDPTYLPSPSFIMNC